MSYATIYCCAELNSVVKFDLGMAVTHLKPFSMTG